MGSQRVRPDLTTEQLIIPHNKSQEQQEVTDFTIAEMRQKKRFEGNEKSLKQPF